MTGTGDSIQRPFFLSIDLNTLQHAGTEFNLLHPPGPSIRLWHAEQKLARAFSSASKATETSRMARVSTLRRPFRSSSCCCNPMKVKGN